LRYISFPKKILLSGSNLIQVHSYRHIFGFPKHISVFQNKELAVGTSKILELVRKVVKIGVAGRIQANNPLRGN
jgi:hypothetical protein